MFVLIAYDVAADRTQLFKKTLHRFLNHKQNSLFIGELPKSEYQKMLVQLKHIFVKETDKVWILVSENRFNAESYILNENDNHLVYLEEENLHHQSGCVI